MGGNIVYKYNFNTKKFNITNIKQNNLNDWYKTVSYICMNIMVLYINLI